MLSVSTMLPAGASAGLKGKGWGGVRRRPKPCVAAHLSRARAPLPITPGRLPSGRLPRPPSAEGGEAAPTAASPASASAAATSPYDWRAQWYPVSYVADLTPDVPTRVWLFDEPYAVSRRTGGRPPIAFKDVCPHRSAALSEGRVTAGGLLQCAYHGWAFDGTSGACASIPHAPPGGAGPASSPACAATPYPCVEAQGMVWVAPVQPGTPPPPLSALVGIRELGEPGAPHPPPGWATADFVRSFPIDASLLLENVSDPDHGLFAHQTLNFDGFSAGGASGKRMTVVEAPGRGGAPRIVGTVPASPVLGPAAKGGAGGRGKDGRPAPTPTATLEVEPPIFCRWSRSAQPGGTPAFIACFYAVPEGVGRCKLFIRYARSIAPWLPVPRWVVALGLNAFLDQDSQLVATQQAAVLGGEAAAAAAAAAAGAGGAAPPPKPFRRASLFAYRSPTEAFLARLGQWLDASLPSQPNRAAGLVAGAWAASPPAREAVLDRWAGHTALVPGSRAVHARAAAAAAVLTAVAVVATAVVAAALAPGGALAGAPAARVAAWALVPGLAAALARGCAWLASRFVYCYSRSDQAKDLERIARLVPSVEGIVGT